MLWDTVEETLDRVSEKVRDAEEALALEAEATRELYSGRAIGCGDAKCGLPYGSRFYVNNRKKHPYFYIKNIKLT
jgi:hypothetical protein